MVRIGIDLWFRKVGVVLQELKDYQAVIVHALNPNTWEAWAGVFLSLKPAWSTE